MKTATALVLLALSIVPVSAGEQLSRTGSIFNAERASAPTPDQLTRIIDGARANGCAFEIDGDGRRYAGRGYKSWIWTGGDGQTHVLTVYPGDDGKLDSCMPDAAQ